MAAADVEKLFDKLSKTALESREPEALYADNDFDSEIFSVSQLAGEIQQRRIEGIKRGEHPGWDSLAEYYRPRKGEWTVVTGIPGHGKSTWLDNLLINLFKRSQWKFGVFSAENWPLARHAENLISIYSGQPIHEGWSPALSDQGLDLALQLLGDSFFLIRPDENHLNITSILDMAGWLVEKRAIDGLVIDPWNELDHSRPEGMTETENVSRSLSLIRRFSQRRNVHTWLVAHPKMLVPDKDGNYPKPGMYHISGSAHFRNKADMGVMVWRDLQANTPEAEIHIQKVRFSENGEVGMVKLKVERASKRFFE